MARAMIPESSSLARIQLFMNDYKLFVCVQCGFEYDEALGWPEDGIAPGTRWADIPDDWSCPDCGAAKSDFEMVEVARP